MLGPYRALRPHQRAWLPIVGSGTFAKPTSMIMAISGLISNGEVKAPPRVTSSCAEATRPDVPIVEAFLHSSRHKVVAATETRLSSVPCYGFSRQFKGDWAKETISSAHPHLGRDFIRTQASISSRYFQFHWAILKILGEQMRQWLNNDARRLPHDSYQLAGQNAMVYAPNLGDIMHQAIFYLPVTIIPMASIWADINTRRRGAFP